MYRCWNTNSAVLGHPPAGGIGKHEPKRNAPGVFSRFLGVHRPYYVFWEGGDLMEGGRSQRMFRSEGRLLSRSGTTLKHVRRAVMVERRRHRERVAQQLLHSDATPQYSAVVICAQTCDTPPSRVRGKTLLLPRPRRGTSRAARSASGLIDALALGLPTPPTDRAQLVGGTYMHVSIVCITLSFPIARSISGLLISPQ